MGQQYHNLIVSSIKVRETMKGKQVECSKAKGAKDETKERTEM